MHTDKVGALAQPEQGTRSDAEENDKLRGRTLLHLMPVYYLGGVTLPFDVNLLDISFTVLLATPFRDLRGAR